MYSIFHDGKAALHTCKRADKGAGLQEYWNASRRRLASPTGGARKYLMWLGINATLPPWPTVTSQKVRVGVPVLTKAHARKPPVSLCHFLAQKQQLKSSAL